MIFDWLYVIGRPLAYGAGVLGIKRIIHTRSTKAFSITGNSIAFSIVLATFLRSLFTLHDLIFWLNALVGLIMAGIELALVIKWRKK